MRIHYFVESHQGHLETIATNAAEKKQISLIHKNINIKSLLLEVITVLCVVKHKSINSL